MLTSLRKRFRIQLRNRFRKGFYVSSADCGVIQMPTIKDISRRCGVSPATVSKALNGYSDIGAETAEMIRRVAQEMHYLPNQAARQLKTNISHNIGVVFEDETRSGLTHEYFSRVLNSAKREMEQRGYDITFLCTAFGGSFTEHCRYRKCDGVLIASVDFTHPAILELVNSEFPVLTIDYAFDSHSSVISDNVEGAFELTRYLIGMGHRKIAFIHGEDTSVTRKRIAGFYRACQESGIDIPDDYLVLGRYHDTEASAKATETLMNMRDRPTAILYPDDFAYLGGRIQLEKMGLSVPEDVSVAGYDGIPLSQVIRPRLTTWYQDAELIGEVSGRKLIETIENPKGTIAEELRVPGKLLEGGSVRDLRQAGGQQDGIAAGGNS